ncbi:carbohydrate ABC transporter permease [Streptomyces cavernicola]|uniref:Carbohydrate ABC transporter permease n=1 Tax=Streptomyces cavernicola TaxID=3043613 RepID=A0ABT6S7X8_9ACTN|nr:carbohydrate ABC transporter permease [Streptomyces sp. B-S-A6]MDI3404208.1 carbohydrate ABC transporter permease [Streptomyces sp. B-S-A6]
MSTDSRTLARANSARQQGSWWTPRRVVSHVLLVLVTFLFLTPVLYALATALKPAGETFASPPSLVGSSVRWQNFADVFDYLPFQRFVVNGLLVAVVGTLVVLAASSLGAYAFARLRWRGRESLFLLFLGTLMVPQEVLVVPMFILMQEFGWVNSYQALVFPWAFTAFGTFLLRQFFRQIPYELQEAATLDGCSPLRTFRSVMLPIAKPALGVVAVFTFISYWNSFLWPLIIVNDVHDLGTVPLGLSLFFGQNSNQWHLVMAASVISLVPTLLLLIALQKHLVKGIAATGLAGR